ncbi:beta-parvin-like [Sycon ciliatum]|uniref:beta-parvin-like n=1 Tax=Sycon ciliatum TaxID=27933 RepID=UPI0031F6E277
MAKRTWRCDFKSHLVLASSENNQEQLSKLTESLLDWINDTVRKRSIVVRSFFADLWDGSVLVELLEILRGVQLGIGPNIHISVSGSAVREKWEAVLREIEHDLGVEQLGAVCGQWGHEECDDTSAADYELGVHSSLLEELLDRNPLALLQVATQLALYHRSGGYPKLPVNITLDFVRATRHMNTMVTVPLSVRLTAEVDIFWHNQNEILELQNAVTCVRCLYQSGQRHVLVDSLLEFVNNHLGVITKPAESIGDFASGVLFILLAGMLGSFFVRLDSFFAVPFSHGESLHNADMALTLLQESGSPQLEHVRTICTPEDIADNEERAIVQLLYAIKTFYV